LRFGIVCQFLTFRRVSPLRNLIGLEGRNAQNSIAVVSAEAARQRHGTVVLSVDYRCEW
jgi:hypothetical protein